MNKVVKKKFRVVEKGNVYYADLGNGQGSEQSGTRPVVIIQNDIGNRYSPTVIVASITSQLDKTKLPTHVKLKDYDNLDKDSIVLLEQIRTLDKNRLKEFRFTVDIEDMKKINKSLMISLAL